MIDSQQLKELNAQDWADFKAHWPMRVMDAFKEVCGGFVVGVFSGLLAVMWAIKFIA